MFENDNAADAARANLEEYYRARIAHASQQIMKKYKFVIGITMFSIVVWPFLNTFAYDGLSSIFSIFIGFASIGISILILAPKKIDSIVNIAIGSGLIVILIYVLGIVEQEFLCRFVAYQNETCLSDHVRFNLTVIMIGGSVVGWLIGWCGVIWDKLSKTKT